MSGEIPLVHFQFLLPTAHPNRIPIDGNGDIYTGTFMRTGCMASFDSFDHFKQYSDEILDLLEDLASPVFASNKVLDVVDTSDSVSDDRRMSTSINVSISGDSTILRSANENEQKSVEPIHILSIAVRDLGDLDDLQMANLFGAYCGHHREELLNRRVRRITFAALKK